MSLLNFVNFSPTETELPRQNRRVRSGRIVDPRVFSKSN
jgi:hypothetical protein